MLGLSVIDWNLREKIQSELEVTSPFFIFLLNVLTEHIG